MMKKKGKTMAACLFAAVWWGIFYPELCFTEETCEAVVTAETQTEDMSGQIGAAEIWDASGDEIVISSRFLEWCEEKLAVGKD
ncbi:MAG: hypothetical protein HFI56_00800 [Lachnospiraceae bacterium]|jgi:hypothetical protein|nr:hypothetical protein [Lachnospiraceae bacterium]MCI9396548.1 hypothetical protein [Lachnospiraceae bacterium]